MRRHLKAAIVTVLTVGLMIFFFRNADFAQVWQEVLRAEGGLLAIGLLLMLCTYLFRVERWRYLLLPVAPTRFSSAFRATVIGFTVNALLPGRAGEVVRPYVLARQEGLSATSAFATIVIERLLDLVVVCLIVSSFVLFFGPQSTASNTRLLSMMESGAFAAGLIAIILLVAVGILAGDLDRIKRLLARLEQLGSGGLMRRLALSGEQFLEGLAVVRQVRPLGVALAWSLPLWFTMAVSIWCVTNAFGMEIPLGGAMILMALMVVGVALPTPGGVGGYHAAYQIGATVLYGAQDDRAVGAALVLHLFSFGPVTLLGLVFMARDGLRLTGLRELSKTNGKR